MLQKTRTKTNGGRKHGQETNAATADNLVDEDGGLVLVSPDLAVQSHHHPRLGPHRVRREQLIRQPDRLNGGVPISGRGGDADVTEIA